MLKVNKWKSYLISNISVIKLHHQSELLKFLDYDFEKKVKSTLEMMLELSEHENKFSDKELRDHSLSFIIAVNIQFVIKVV